MSANFDDKPYSESHLESPEYRRRLMRKLNTLIAVLEVACAKVRSSLAGPEPDVERLTRIQKNLRETLSVCIRAKTALERCEKLPGDFPAHLSGLTDANSLGATPDPNLIPQPPRGSEVEMSSPSELAKFSELDPIDPQDVRSCDLDDLCRQLLGGL